MLPFEEYSAYSKARFASCVDTANFLQWVCLDCCCVSARRSTITLCCDGFSPCSRGFRIRRRDYRVIVTGGHFSRSDREMEESERGAPDLGLPPIFPSHVVSNGILGIFSRCSLVVVSIAGSWIDL